MKTFEIGPVGDGEAVLVNGLGRTAMDAAESHRAGELMEELTVAHGFWDPDKGTFVGQGEDARQQEDAYDRGNFLDALKRLGLPLTRPSKRGPEQDQWDQVQRSTHPERHSAP